MISACLLAVAMTAGAPDASAGADREAYEAAAAAAGRDARAHVDLALWCEARGLAAEKAKHLARAVLLDPDDPRARGLLGQVRRDGKWMRPADVARSVEESPEQQALLREYLERRARARDQADDQYKLGLWCEEKGLKEPMAAHLRRTLQLDPGREGALRRLGYKKSGGRWVDPEAVAALKAAREAQAAADRAWTPRLVRLRDALGSRDGSKRAEAAEALAAVDDPLAVPAAWAVFAEAGDEAGQRASIDLFGRIEGPAASIALARLAVFSPHPGVRADAAQVLIRRDPREYASLLAGLIRKEVRYQVKNVEGPGTHGELLVEGEGANVRRVYTPLAPIVAPGMAVDPAAVTTLGVGGPRDGGVVGYAIPGAPMHTLSELQAQTDARNAARGGRLAEAGDLGRRVVDALVPAEAAPVLTERAGRLDPNSRSFQAVAQYQDLMDVPIGMMVAETRYSALVAQRQLLDDVARIEMRNAPVREVNERAANILKAVGGRDYGDDGEKWKAWAVDVEGYAYRSPVPEVVVEVPTYVEEVPLAFVPQAVPTTRTVQTGSTVLGTAPPPGPRPRIWWHNCFAAGTPVRTLQGARPIEAIRPGDMVLSQDVATGEFRYRAVGTVFHNPPNETYRIGLGGESIVATGIHRFWKAGRGWALARELKAGDRLRTVGGSVEVTAVEKDRVQPVFNLQLVDGDSFCVGAAGVVAHDNSLAAPVARPFDAVPADAQLAAASKP